MTPRILILGLGALGGRIACQLSLAGVPILGVLRDHGGTGGSKKDITYQDRHGNLLRASVPIAASPAEARDFNPTYALVAVKSYHTPQVCDYLLKALPQGAAAVTLQNGLGNLERLEQTLGRDRAAAGVCTYGASLSGDRVLWGGDGEIALGSLWGRDLSDLAQALRSAGFNARLSNDPLGDLWQKAAVNCCINPLTAILRIPNGGLLKSPCLKIVDAVVHEVALAANLMGVKMDPQKTLDVVRRVMEATCNNKSSMLQDIEAGRPTEIDALSLEIARICRAAKMDAPVCRTLGLLVKAMEGTTE
ncbi:MAG: ketopantoate reductase family protein [Thermanaerothrix sp.]|nr:ketopantoate reductase family protein [Thermanaerothrix sp.]